jgi:hypothetical protein
VSSFHPCNSLEQLKETKLFSILDPAEKMALGTLEKILSPTEYLTINATVREKIEKRFKKQEENHTALKEQHANLQTQFGNFIFLLHIFHHVEY